VNVNFSSVSSTLDLKLRSSLTTVCGMSSAFVQGDLGSRFHGERCRRETELSILTSAAGGPAAIDFSTVGSAAKASMADAADTENQTLNFFVSASASPLNCLMMMDCSSL